MVEFTLPHDLTTWNLHAVAADKKGYFGERMETSAAASRYIECKIGKIAQLVL